MCSETVTIRYREHNDREISMDLGECKFADNTDFKL
jgi:hypothetical protein